MSMNVPFKVLQGNDETFALVATDAIGRVIDLTSSTAKVVVKANAAAGDGSGTTYASGGANLTIASGTQGQATFKLPHAATGIAGTQWYRFDVIDGSGNVYTSQYGLLNIIAV
jgi:hypothetical protein